MSDQGLSAHSAPPAPLKEIFKRYQKITLADVDSDEEILDFSRDCIKEHLRVHHEVSSDLLSDVCSGFLAARVAVESKQVYYHPALPGLLMVPSLFTEEVQSSLLARMIHRDLSDSRHRTNVHMHYNVEYPQEHKSKSNSASSFTSNGVELTTDCTAATKDSAIENSFFSIPPSSSSTFPPKDPVIHKPLSISKFMNKSLRWVTLGGQYDWTRKIYPEEQPPDFPADIGSLLGSLFSEMKPQAAIVNFYSPGDTLSLHRDVSEQVDKGLVSVSIGCDCLFIIGLNDGSDTVVLRLRSGDAVYMSREARFAWHGVPKILPQTCPSTLRDWPAQEPESRYEEWRGWLSTKRINLNVRQMFEN